MDMFLNTFRPFIAMSICWFRDSEWHLKQVVTQETGWEEKYFDILNITRSGIHPGYYIIPKFLGLLFALRSRFVDI